MIIESYTGFQPLKEVWLGDCYPVEWYYDFDARTQDFFCQITEITKADLTSIEKKLIELGVAVERPVLDDRNLFLDDYDAGSKRLEQMGITPHVVDFNHGFQSWTKCQTVFNDIVLGRDIDFTLKPTEEALLNVLFSKAFNIYSGPLYEQDQWPINTSDVYKIIQAQILAIDAA